MSRTSRFRRLAAGAGVDGTRGGGGAVVTRVTDGSSSLLNSDVDDARGVTGRENVSIAVAAPTARREASAATRQQQGADVMAPRWQARRRDGPAGKVAPARCGGIGIRRRTRKNTGREACMRVSGDCWAMGTASASASGAATLP
jgi:hypothetical protein